MSSRFRHLFLIGGWLLLTVSLTIWWLIYGLKQTERLGELSKVLPEEVYRGQRMLHWEGGFLILLLIVGGTALFYYSLREFQRNRQTKEFFATMTHELKTPLASLRLQVESLQEDLSGTEHLRLIDRLARDAARLEMQLENALFLASVKDSTQLHLENLKVKQIIAGLKQTWPEIEIAVADECVVRADTRALEGVLKNLVQNARVHGQATKISITASRDGGGKVKLSVADNGAGFEGDVKKLGQLFVRHTPVSGSGVGLYLAQQLTRKMNGKLEFEKGDRGGFKANVILEGSA